jgi:hypothetical protein
MQMTGLVTNFEVLTKLLQLIRVSRDGKVVGKSRKITEDHIIPDLIRVRVRLDPDQCLD